MRAFRWLLGEPARLDALCFGNADFSLDMGVADGDLSAGVVYHARCSLAITAAAAGVAAIDGVCLADPRRRRVRIRGARAALSLGFTGQAVHPPRASRHRQRRVHADVPSRSLGQGRMVDASLRRRSKRGKGVFALDGKMVDAPVLQLQQRLLERARRAGVLDSA